MPTAVVRAQQRVPLALELRLRPAGARGAGGGARLCYNLGVELRDVREGGGGEVREHGGDGLCDAPLELEHELVDQPAHL